MPERDVAALYVRWTFTRAIFHRGWWLVTSLYLVVEAGLSPLELVLVGTAQQVTAIALEVPTGVFADTISRKGSLVIAHLVMGAGMLATGLVTSFPALAATQMLWGAAWTFSSGADVAWLTDELDDPRRTPAVLSRSARYDQIGAACGLVAFGALAWATTLATAIVGAGAAMWVLGAIVALRFPERNFAAVRVGRWRRSAEIFRSGLALARRDRQILLVFAATVLVNGASDGFERLHAKRLVDLGLPASQEPIVWLTLLGLAALGLGAVALRIVEARIDGVRAAPRLYAGACVIGALALALLALAPDPWSAMAGAIIVSGIAWSVTRTVGVIWVNRRATSDVRATVQSFLAQAEYAGEIVLGVSLGVLAQASGIPVAIVGAAALLAVTAGMVGRSRD